MNRLPACPLCAAQNTVPYCVKEPYRILRCGACGNGFLAPPAAFNPEEIYRKGYHRKPEDRDSAHGYDDYFAMEPAFEKTFGERLREILRLAPPRPGARLLDIGCGPGFFLELARKHYKVAGVELGSEAVEYARTRLNLDVADEPFRRGLFAPGSFAAITLFDTIEHLPKPLEAIGAVYEMLEPAGLLMLSTGDFSSLTARLSGRRWHLLNVPEHLFYFTRPGLARILEAEGFEVLSTTYPAGHFTAEYLFERLVKSVGLGRTCLRWSGLRSLLRRLILPMNLFDIMLVAAKKRPF